MSKPFHFKKKFAKVLKQEQNNYETTVLKLLKHLDVVKVFFLNVSDHVLLSSRSLNAGCDIELCQKLRLTLQNARIWKYLYIKCVICPDTSSFHSNGRSKPISVQFFGGGIFSLHPA